MEDPYNAHDSTITESPYSSNTLIDFKNNILGLQHVYMGLMAVKGFMIWSLQNNLQLDQQIQATNQCGREFFRPDHRTIMKKPYTHQRIQVKQTMDQLDALNDIAGK